MIVDTPYQVFCCYARKDQEFLQDLKTHLKALEREGLIIVKADIDISPGVVREVALNHYIEVADIILLLISPDFLASDNCFNNEMQQALARHEQGTARVVPVIIRSTDWQKTPFSKLQCLPTDAKPVSKWPDRDDAFISIAKGLRAIIQTPTINTRAKLKKVDTRWPIAAEDLFHASAQREDGRNFGAFSGNNTNSVGPGGIQVNANNSPVNIYGGIPKDGILALQNGARALQDADYSSAKKELRVAIEEIDEKKQPREAAQAHYFRALALLEGMLPRTHGSAVMRAVDELMNKAIRIYPCASYYRIFACIKRNSFESKGYNTLERQGAFLPRCDDDEKNENYFRRCQPRLQF